MKKQQNKYKLTPEICAEIKEAAAKLPKFQKQKNGKPLNRVLHIQKSEKVGAIKICEPILVNHEINLQKDYQTHGRDGIANYIAAVYELQKQYREDPTYQLMNN